MVGHAQVAALLPLRAALAPGNTAAAWRGTPAGTQGGAAGVTGTAFRSQHGQAVCCRSARALSAVNAVWSAVAPRHEHKL